MSVDAPSPVGWHGVWSDLTTGRSSTRCFCCRPYLHPRLIIIIIIKRLVFFWGGAEGGGLKYWLTHRCKLACRMPVSTPEEQARSGSTVANVPRSGEERTVNKRQGSLRRLRTLISISLSFEPSTECGSCSSRGCDGSPQMDQMDWMDWAEKRKSAQDPTCIASEALH